MLKFKDIALKNREHMLKTFIDENKKIKEELQALGKANKNVSVRLNDISMPRAKTITFSTETNLQDKIMLLEQKERDSFNTENKKNGGLRKNLSIKEQIRKNKESKISKGVFTTSRNFVKAGNSSRYVYIYTR